MAESESRPMKKVIPSSISELIAEANMLIRKQPGKKGGDIAEIASLSLSGKSHVSEWLSGAREPSGSNTLHLLRWVISKRRRKNRNTHFPISGT